VPVMRRVISNGVDLRPQPCGTRQLSAVTAGRLWDPGKGLAVFHALESPMPIAIAGEEWNSDAAADVPPGALMHGALSREGLLQLFGESAVYVCASLYEPFGLAALEAALCGCAVVARDLPSLREVWGGAAVYFRTAGELSQLLTGLYGDRATLQAAQSRALRRARRYTRERMVKAYRALYGRAAAGEQVRVA
jgi:glycogen(starch) synthase